MGLKVDSIGFSSLHLHKGLKHFKIATSSNKLIDNTIRTNQFDSLIVEIDNFVVTESTFNSPELKSLYISSKSLSSEKGISLDGQNISNLTLNVLDSNYIIPKEFADLTIGSLTLTGYANNHLPQGVSRLSNLYELIVSIRGIEELPYQIGQLKNLKILRLRGLSRLQDNLPSNLNNLTNLEELEIADMNLKRLNISFKNFPKLEKLVLNKLNTVKSFPNDVGSLSRLKHLDIEGLIRSDDFTLDICNLTNLEYLKLSGINKMKLIGNINTLKKLRYLDLSWLHNSDSLDLEFDNLKYLKELAIKYVTPKNFEPDFSTLKELESISINQRFSESELSKFETIPNLKRAEFTIENNIIPNNWFENSHLEKLKIDYKVKNKGVLNPNLYTCTKIDSLMLSGKFTAIENDIGKLNDLTYLKIVLADIKILPSGIGRFKNLKKLILHSLFLEELPESISELESLESLKLFNLNLNQLPESFGDLKNLRELSICNGIDSRINDRKRREKSIKLDELPESFSDLSSLTNLYIKDVPLSSLPDNFGNLQNLESIVLNKTRVDDLPDSFSQLDKLWYLKIYDDTYEYTVSSNLFPFPEEVIDLKNLKVLILSKISNIPDEVSNMPSLQQFVVIGELDEINPNIMKIKNLDRLNITTLGKVRTPDYLTRDTNRLYDKDFYHRTLSYYNRWKMYGGANYKNENAFIEIGAIRGKQIGGNHGMFSNLWTPFGLSPSISFRPYNGFIVAPKLTYVFSSFLIHSAFSTSYYTNFKGNYSWTINPELGINFFGLIELTVAYNFPVLKNELEEVEGVEVVLHFPF